MLALAGNRPTQRPLQDLLTFVNSRETPGTIKDPYYRAKSLGLASSPIRMTPELAANICATNSAVAYVGLDYLTGMLVTTRGVHESKSGKNITILQGRYVGQYDSHSFVAYPENTDMNLLHKAAKATSAGAGPAMLFPGSIGQLAYEIRKDSLHVQYLQSSVNFPKALSEGILSKDFKRSYFSWTICLVTCAFERAAQLKLYEVQLPDCKTISFLAEQKILEKIASRFAFNQVGNKDSNKLRFLRGIS